MRMNVVVEETLTDIARFRRELRTFSKLFEPLPAAPKGTGDALTSLYLRIASLSSTGVLACADGEIYAARALTRCLSEHWMRFMSIVAGSATGDFFGDLKESEAVEIDRRMRNCFPTGRIPSDVPGEVRSAIASALIEPVPSKADRDRAQQVGQKFSFPELCKGLLAALKAHDGRDDAAYYGMMAFAYARFSACVHGGPLGHDYITSAPSAAVIANTASDLLVAWASALTMLLAKLRGLDDDETRKAIALRNAFVGWAAHRVTL